MRDSVDRPTPLGPMVPTLLEESDMHPCAMMRLRRQRHAERLVPITNATMSHTVTRPESMGLLAEVGDDHQGSRPERIIHTLTGADWARREPTAPPNKSCSNVREHADSDRCLEQRKAARR